MNRLAWGARRAVLGSVMFGMAAWITSPAAVADEITGVTIEGYSSQLPGTVQPCCDRHADYLVTDTGLNVNGPGTVTTVPDGGFMWLSDQNSNIASQYVTFDLGAVYDLDGARVWNYNEVNILTRGVYQMIVRVSEDNVTYHSLGEYVLDKAPDPASAYRDFSQYVPLKVANVRYVQFDVQSSWGDANYVGLSKVRFYSAPASDTPVSSGLIMHLDASDTDGDGNPDNEPGFGATVPTWVDKSGQGNNAVLADGAPLLHRDELNGHPAIRFNGDDRYTLGDYSGLTAGEIFIVVRADQFPPQASTSTGLWNMGTDVTLQTHYSWVSGTLYDAWGTNTRNENITVNVPLDQWNVYSVSSAPGAWSCALNGVTQRTRASNTVTFPAISSLGRSFGGVFFEGAIAEVLMYNRALNAAERSQVNDYLDRKYDLSGTYNEPDNSPPVTEGITIHLDASTDGQVGNGGVLGTWQDRSGNAFSATAVGDPVWVRNSLGGKAALRFDGVSDEYSLGNLASQFPSGATVFVATSFNDAAYNLFSTKNDADPWWRYNGNGRSYASAFRNPRAENFDAMPSTGEYVYTLESTASFWQMYQDGLSKAAVGASYNAGNDYRISAGFGVQDKRLSGDISEVIVYDRALSSEKRAAVQAYLSEKYRINAATSDIPVTNGRVLHLAADAIPDAADGGALTSWNDLSASGLTATAAGDPRYRDNRINGKPVIEFDGSGDTFSVPLSTSNTMTLIAVVRGSNYQSMFRWQPGNWIVYPWGNGNLIQTSNGGTAESGSLNAGLVPDEWNIATAVVNTGPTNGVKTYRNGVLKQQKTYTAWGNLSPLWIGSINGGGEYMSGEMAELIVYHRALSDDERRQVERFLADKYGLNGTGPGGLEKSDLELWLRADRGVVKNVSNVVSEWGDQSGFNRYVYQDSAAQRPDWIPNSVNGLPVIRFNPNGDVGNGTLVEYFKSDGIWPGGTPGAVGASLVFAAKSNINDTFGYQSIIRYQGATWLINPWYNTVIINEDSGTSGVNTGLVPLQWNISEGLFRANQTNGFQTYNKGALVAQKNSANVVLGANQLLVGACCGGAAVNAESPNADVGEIVTFSERLNDARRVLLQNYMSARFNTALTANDIYAGDTAGAGNYDWDLAGIGRSGNPVDFGDGANALGAGRHMLGNSAGMIVEEISFLQDSGDYIVIGHNDVPNDLTNNDLAGSGAQRRWNRIWYLDKTDVNSNGGQVRLTFDISDGNPGGLNSGDLVLLRRAGTTGNFSIIANNPAALGDQYSFVLNANSLTDAYYTVAEVDTTDPVITLSGGNLNIECGSGYTDPGFTASDNSDGDVTGSVVLSGATVNPNNVGVYVVRYNVTDTAGNSAIEQTRTVTVQDTSAPVITRIGAAIVSVECGTPYSDAGATANDSCTPSLTVVTGGLPINTSSTGTHVVTYNVSDAQGNPAAQVTRTVNVVDTTPPNLVLVGTDMTLECGVDTFTDPGANATDTCAGVVPVVVGGSVNANSSGTYVLTYDATDGTNAAPQQTRTVTVQDTLGPVITVTGSANQTVVAGQPFVDAGATALDACEGAVAVVTGGDTVNNNVVGTYVITYNAQDGGGRPAAQKTRTVNVVAGNPPSITLNGSATVTLECADSYTDAGATATDVEDNDVTLTGNIVTTGLPIPVGVPGTYTVTYDVTDSSGNPATQQSRTVIVEDTEAPTLTRLGNVIETVTCGAVYTDAGATATDVCGDDTALTAAIAVTGLPIPFGTPGSYTVTYNVTDAGGNAAAPVSRTVNVVDNVAPSLTLLGAPVVTVECGGAYTDSGATASDTCDDNSALTSAIVVGGLPIDTNAVGPHTVTYDVQDVAGNPATQITRVVFVEDNSAPVINLNGAPRIEVDLGGVYLEPGASANDSCEGDVPVIVGGDFVDTATEGTYIVTYDAMDSSGNNAPQRTREVVVSAGEAPFITEQPTDQTANYLEDATFQLSAIAIDTISYQWFLDGSPLADGANYAGATTDTLTAFTVDNGDEADFTCRVTSQGVSVLSVVARLTVNDPGITQQPVGQVVAPGSTAQFTVGAVGSGTLTYQWKFGNTTLVNGGDISGADTATLSIASAEEGTDEGEYYCIVSGGLDPPIESDRATLTVGNPVIVSHPVSIEVLQGGTAEFEVEAVGVPPLLYRWRKDGVNLTDGSRFSGVSTPKLTITGALKIDEGVYSCRVVGQNIVESNPATLTVLGPPVLGGVQRLPASGISPIQGPAAFTVLVSDGATPFTYQWRRNGTPLSDSARISGSGSATLTISTCVEADTGSYDCVVSNAVGSETSESTSLKVGLTFVGPLIPRIVEQNEVFHWSIQVAGSFGDPIYQWLKSDGSKTFVPLMDIGAVTGTDTDTLLFNPLAFSDEGIYRVDVSDGLGTYMSNEAELQVVESLPASKHAVMFLLVAVFTALGGAVLRRRRSAAIR